MTSAGSWLAFRRFFKVTGFFYNQPCYIPKNENCIIPRPRKDLRVWNLLLCDVILFLFTTAYLLLNGIMLGKNDPEFHPGRPLLWTFIMVATIFVLILAQTLIFHTDELCWGFANMHFVSKQFTDPVPKGKIDWQGLSLHVMIFSLLVTPSSAFMFPLFVDVDPYFYILRPLGLPRIVSKLIRGVANCVGFYHGVTIIINILIPTAVFMLVCAKLLKYLRRKPFATRKWGKAPNKIHQVQQATERFIEFRETDRQLRILTILAMDLTQYSIPFGLVIAMILTVLSGFAVLTLWGKFPPGIYFVCAILWIGIPYIVLTGFSIVAQLHEQSKANLRMWKRHAHYLRKAEQKALKSLRPFALRAGPYFYLNGNTKGEYLQSIVQNTINLILTLQIDI